MLLRNLFIVICFGLFSSTLTGQSLSWSNFFNQGLDGSEINDMKADKQGNLVVAGTYSTYCTLNGKKLLDANFILPNGRVPFLAKFDASGHLLWMDTTFYIDNVEHIEISESGNYYFSGDCAASAAPFGAPNPTALHSIGFIGKCDPNGKMYWVRKYLNYSNSGQGILNFKVDAAENIYFWGLLPPYPDNFRIDTTQYYYKPGDSINYCLVKFDSSGHLVWLTREIPRGKPAAYDEMDIDQKGNVYAISNYNYAASKLLSQLFKLDNNGHLVRKFDLDSTWLNSIYTLCTDNSNNIYISCTVEDTLNLFHMSTTGKFFGCLAKLDSDLNIIWTRFTSAGSGAGWTFANKKTGSVFIISGYQHRTSLGGYSTMNNLNDTDTPYSNIFLAKIDPLGGINWLLNTTYMIQDNGVVPFAEDNCGNLFTAFNFAKQLHFNGLNYNYPYDYGAVIAKFSSDSLGFQMQSNDCNGLVLTNTSKPVFKQFQWYAKSVNDTTIGKLAATSRDLQYRFPHKGKFIITLLAIKSGGCTNTVQDTFTVPGSPVGGFSAADTQGCQYVQFNFSDTSHADTINAAIGQSWYWDFGDHSSPLTYSQTKRPVVSHVYTQSGTYTVKLVYGNGLCTDTFVSQKKVVIIPAPKPGFSVSDTVGCAPLSVNVTDGSVGTVMRWVYVIKKIPLAPFVKGDSLLSPSFRYSFSSPGIYMIHQYLTGTTGCLTEDSVLINVTPVFNDGEKADINVASVDTNLSSQASSTVNVQWLPYPGATGYSLYRYADNDSATVVLALQTANTTYHDNGLDPAHHSYSYYVKALDGCGHFTGHGRVGKTIKLSGFENGNLLPQLAWTPYKDWPGWASNYQILRQDPDATYKIIGSAKDTSYQDTALTARDIYGECYRVRTLRNDTFPISYSNIFCFGNSPQIFIPNIFTPNGDTLNDVFAPVFSGIKSYSMTIINRWGEKVFTSQSSSLYPSPLGEGRGEAGWDGSFKGQVSPNGIYIYYIKAEDFNGNTIIKKGTVMLQQ